MILSSSISAVIFFLFAILLYFSDRTERSKWLSALFFIGFLFAFTLLSQRINLLPFYFVQLIAFVHAFFFPYCLLMLSIVSLNNNTINKYKKYLHVISLIIIIIFFIIDPGFGKFGEYVLRNKPDIPFFTALFIWVSIYTIFANILLILSIFNEQDFVIKKDNIITAILAIPGSLIILIFSYLQPIISTNVKSCDTAVSALIFIISLAFFFFFTWGFYGIKIRIENHYQANTQKTLNLSTSIINHTIKNELQKLAACSEMIRINKDPKNLNDIAQIISNSTRHLSAVINRIQAQLTDIALIKRNIELDAVINESLEMLQPSLVNKNITITKNFGCETHINGDETHLKEVFINIFNNAMEAMNDGGRLTIDGVKKKKEIIISITDTGKGISSADLVHVFDLFFTTKGTGHYGLGLCYCYNVIKKHDGNITIQSEENVGTTLIISLPLK